MGRVGLSGPRLVEQPKLPSQHDSLDACPDAKRFVSLFQVFLDRALRNPEDLPGIARALSFLCPGQAFDLAPTQCR
jgi:hypothetical protein